jgi:hypothetical protein
LALLVAAASTCSPSPAFEGDPYGEPLTLTEVTDVSTILAAPDEWIGRRVLIEGEVREVCEMMGCWMDIQASDQLITVKVADGVIVFPLSARGRTAWVEGTVEALELTAEQALAEARHRAEEQGRPFDETATYPPTTIYRIQGIGAVIAS